MVKRVLRITNGDLFLVGDNPDPLASEDSHNFGPVPCRLVEARWLGIRGGPDGFEPATDGLRVRRST